MVVVSRPCTRHGMFVYVVYAIRTITVPRIDDANRSRAARRDDYGRIKQ